MIEWICETKMSFFLMFIFFLAMLFVLRSSCSFIREQVVFLLLF